MSRRKRIAESLLTSVDPGYVLSNANTFSNKSDSTQEQLRQFGQSKNVTQNDGRKVVDEIINAIFEGKLGVANVSSSHCSINDGFRESEDMDKRLKQWQNTLRDRAKMQQRISRKTGRRPEEMLFTLPVTVEQRDKGTVQRLMDYASRLNPVKRSEKQIGVLPELCDECVCVPEVRETLPMPEQEGMTVLEITGLPNATRQEMFGPTEEFKTHKSRERTKWLNSKVLDERIGKKATDIGRVLEFYPDVDNLEVVGTNPLKPPIVEHDEDIDLVVNQSIHSISSTTLDSWHRDEGQQLSSEPKSEHINVGIKINETSYILDSRLSSHNLDLHVYFECAPYEQQVKEVLRLENIGRRLIVCDWQPMESRKRPPTFYGFGLDCFLFDHSKLKLFPGDVHITRVLFQPRTVAVGNQDWEMRIFPNVFCTRRNTLQLLLQGKCVPHPEYLGKINKQLLHVVQKSNVQATRNLAAHQAELATLIKPHEQLCPYERAFDEREIFNAHNPGYHCGRFDDLEALKVLYNSVKLPREPAWDLRLATIKKLILRQTEVTNREIFFKAFIDMQQPLICGGNDSSGYLEHNDERERTRLIYVRGCIGNGIEEWEELVMSLEQSCLKSELTRFYARRAEPYSSDDEEPKPWLRQLKSEQPEQYVLRKLRSKKYYRDSLYMHTYTQLCDIAENIVSVIDSTVYI